MKNIEEIKELGKITDRELLEFILSNQILLFREVEYVRQRVENQPIGLGLLEKTFGHLYRESTHVLRAISHYMKDQDKEY